MMHDKELIRRALLGDPEAQKECTEKWIVLPCPFCNGEAHLIRKDDFYSVVCKDGTCIASDIKPEYGETMVALFDWNTRPAPPIGRCGKCETKKRAIVNANGFLICPVSGMEIIDNYFCSYFEPKEE